MTAQLQPVDLVAPGFRGLNLAQSGAILTPEYATEASNCRVDSAGRLASRDGYTDITTTNITGTPPVKTLFDYRQKDGTVEILVAWDGGIANDVADPEGNDISGAVTDADGRWWFQNFNDNVYGFQDGQTPIVYTGTGTFAAVVAGSGTLPTSTRGVALCAFGRVWVLDSDEQTIKYSGLLDATDWGGAGAGSIDMTSVWTDGTDRVTGIFAFNGQLVVFGERHVVIWKDGNNSQLGIQPADMFVSDIITGTGCLTQWSVQAVGDTDLLFLGRNGVQSLSRLVRFASNPVQSVTKNVRNRILDKTRALADPDTIRSTYNPLDGFYLLTIPEQSAPFVSGETFCIDQRYPFQDPQGDVLNIITTWTLAPTAWLTREGSFDLYLGNTEGVGEYRNGTSDNGAAFRFVYQSPWLDLGEQFADRLKMLKRIGSILFVSSSTDIVYKWDVDFDGTRTRSRSVNVESDATAEWGTAEWGLSEYSGGLSLRIIKIPARQRGQYFRLGLEAEITGEFAIQQLELFTKIGRLA